MSFVRNQSSRPGRTCGPGRRPRGRRRPRTSRSGRDDGSGVVELGRRGHLLEGRRVSSRSSRPCPTTLRGLLPVYRRLNRRFIASDLDAYVFWNLDLTPSSSLLSSLPPPSLLPPPPFLLPCHSSIPCLPEVGGAALRAAVRRRVGLAAAAAPRSRRKSWEMFRLETLIELKFLNSSFSSSNVSIRAFRAYPLIEI